MLKHIPSYYTLGFLAGERWSKSEDADRELRRLSSHMSLFFRDYLFMACLGESRHALRKTGQGLMGFEGRDRSSIFKESLLYAPDQQNLDALKFVFDLGGWGDSYGGQKWSNIVGLLMLYGKISDVLFVDGVVNVRHNGGLAFNKHEASLYMDFNYGEFNDSELIHYLDYRRATSLVLEASARYYSRYGFTTGRLSIEYIREKGLGERCVSFLELANSMSDGVYKPVSWGDGRLPSMTRHPVRRCGGCGNAVDEDDDSYRCAKCSVLLCEDCAIYSDDEEEYLCGSCLNGIGNEKRCPVCTQKLSSVLTTTTSCGLVIHVGCLLRHSQLCVSCVGTSHPKQSLYFSVAECVFCHAPTYGDNEQWATMDGKIIHKACYALRPGGNPDDNQASYVLLQKIGAPCDGCGKPVLKDNSMVCDHGFTMHPYCFHKHSLDSHPQIWCDCEQCTESKQKWMNLVESNKDHEPETGEANHQSGVEINSKPMPELIDPLDLVVTPPYKEQDVTQKIQKEKVIHEQLTESESGKYAKVLHDYVEASSAVP